MSGKITQLFIVIIFGCAMVLLGYRELSTKYLAKFKHKQVPQEQLDRVRAIFGTDTDIQKASFDKETAQRASANVENRKSNPDSELKSLLKLILPENHAKNN